MSKHLSKHLGPGHLKGLNKLGDVMVPGDDELQSFSASGCAAEADRILDHMGAKDLADLKMLLLLMSWLPVFVVAAFLGFLERSPRMKGPLGGPLRFVRIGIRGLILTLYYSHPQAHRVLGYQVGVYTADLRG